MARFAANACVLLLVLVSLATTRADEVQKRKNFTACVHKQVEKENSEFKLSAADLQKLKAIIEKEIMKEPLKPHTTGEQVAILREIETLAKKDIPSLSTDILEKMLFKVRDDGKSCLDIVKTEAH